MLAKLIDKSEKLVVGLMSGTSADGVDAALVKIRGHGIATRIELMAFLSQPFPRQVRDRILALAAASEYVVDEISQLNFYLGALFAQAVRAVAEKAGFGLQDIDLIGSHGQTIRHLPESTLFIDRPIASTWQIGDPSVIAKQTGVVTVGDFRPADVAVGGQGAPLVPLFDYLIYRAEDRCRALLNIGGIANITILPKACTIEQVLAFDTGPGNMVMDALSRKYFDVAFDRDGLLAEKGSANEKIVRRLLREGYFHKNPPKSTGRESFGEQFLQRLEKLAERFHLSAYDLIATATELTARSIHKSYLDFVASSYPVDELIVSGGGRYNPVLMRRLGELFKESRVTTSDTFGIPSDAKEAITFAVLANETLCGRPGNIPGATGAREATILGKICQ